MWFMCTNFNTPHEDLIISTQHHCSPPLLGLGLDVTSHQWASQSHLTSVEGLLTLDSRGRRSVSGLSAFLCPLPRLPLQGKEVSKESVKQFYESWISRQNTLSSVEDQDDRLPPPLSPSTAISSRYAYARLKNQASKASWGSSFSRWFSSGIFVNVQTRWMWTNHRLQHQSWEPYCRVFTCCLSPSPSAAWQKRPWSAPDSRPRKSWTSFLLHRLLPLTKSDEGLWGLQTSTWLLARPRRFLRGEGCVW